MFQYLIKSTFKKLNPSEVISGMALGWDMALAQAAINLGIPFIAAVPFIGQENMWIKKTQEYYKELLSKHADGMARVCSTQN